MTEGRAGGGIPASVNAVATASDSARRTVTWCPGRVVTVTRRVNPSAFTDCTPSTCTSPSRPTSRAARPRWFSQAVALSPKDPKLHYDLGRAYRAAGQMDRAKTEMDLSAKLYGAKDTAGPQ